MVNLSSSCLALVALWCAGKRLFSAVALVRVGATDLMTSRSLAEVKSSSALYCTRT